MSISDSKKGDDGQEGGIPKINLPNVREAAAGSVSDSKSTVGKVANGDLSAQRSLVDSYILRKKLCGVCNEKEGKYKCTRCYLPYCSIACSTLHKATHPAIEPPPEAKPKLTPKDPRNGLALRAGTVAAAGSKSPFAALDESAELKTLFQQYPHLPSQLDQIDTATLPPTDGDDGRPKTQYARGTRSGRGRKHEPWNQDRGLENGVQALNRAREAYGKDGEGVREFSKLVLQILSGDENIDATALVQKELAEENARIISQLLNGEL